MPAIQTKQQLLQALEQMDAIELQNIARHVSRLRTRKLHELTPHEADLLKTARRRLPRMFLRRYRELIAKRQAEALTEVEYEELLRFGEEAEALHVKRIEAAVELAQLHHIDAAVLMRDLGIKPAAL